MASQTSIEEEDALLDDINLLAADVRARVGDITSRRRGGRELHYGEVILLEALKSQLNSVYVGLLGVCQGKYDEKSARAEAALRGGGDQ